MAQNLRTDFWYKVNLGVEHLHQPLLDILHNNNNDARYSGLSNDQQKLHQHMNALKLTHQSRLSRFIKREQWEVLCPTNGNTSDSKQWDATLIIAVCKNFLSLPQDLLNIIENSRLTRNKVKHKTLQDLQDETEFDALWNDIRGTLLVCNYNKLNDFDELGKEDLYKADAIKFFENAQKQLESKIEALKIVTQDEHSVLQHQIDIQKNNLKEAISQLRTDFSEMTKEEYEEITLKFGKLTTQLEKMDKGFDELQQRVSNEEEKTRNIVRRVGELEDKKEVDSLYCPILDEVVDILSKNLSTQEMKNLIKSTKPSFLEEVKIFFSDRCRSEYLRNQELHWNNVKTQLLKMEREDLVNHIKATTDITKGLQYAIKHFKGDIQESYLERFPMKPFLNKHGSNALDKKHIRDMYIELAITSDIDFDQNDVLKEMHNHLNSAGEGTKPIVSLEEMGILLMKNKLIFIEGIAGIGKSTLVKKIVSDWYEGRLFSGINGNRIHFLLPILCRELNDHYEDLRFEKAEDMLRNIFPRIPDFSILQELGCNVLIIVDGIDELRDINDIGIKRDSPKLNLVSKLLDRKFMQQFQCVMVGRPHITNQLDSFRKRKFHNTTTKMQVCGFNEKSAKDFVYKQFEDHSQEKANELLERIEQSEVTKQMSTIPLYMQILVSIFKDNPLEIIPSRTSQLLLYSVLVFWRNHCERKPNSLRLSLSKFINTINLTNFMEIFKFAYETLIKRKIVFETNENEYFEELVEMGILLKSTRGESDTTSYQFLHLTFQELFSAFHVLCSNSDPDLGNPALRNTIVIAAGIQGISCGNGDTKESLLFHFLKDVKERFCRDIMVETLKHCLVDEGKYYELSDYNTFLNSVFENQDLPQFFLLQNVEIVGKYTNPIEWQKLYYMVNLISHNYPDFRFQDAKSHTKQPCTEITLRYIEEFVLKVVNLTKSLVISGKNCFSSPKNVVCHLAQQLKSANELKRLTLENCLLTDEQFSMLLDSLVHLESLYLGSNKLTQGSLYSLLKQLRSESPLKEIDFSRNEFENDQFDAIEESMTIRWNQISPPMNLIKITLHACALTDEIFLKLLNLLVHAECIDVSCNKLTHISLYSLLKHLTPNSRLKEFDFCGNESNNYDFDEIDKSNSIHEDQTSIPVNLRKVKLSRCSLTDEIFSMLLNSLVYVEYLDVINNKLTQRSLYRLLKSLTPNTPLKVIDFSLNDFKNHNFDEIEESNIIRENLLLTPVSLYKVTLYNCALTDEIFSKLLDLLIHAECIDLSKNKLTRSSLFRLFRSKRLTPDSPLKEINFSCNQLFRSKRLTPDSPLKEINFSCYKLNKATAINLNETCIFNLRNVTLHDCSLTDTIFSMLLDSLVHVEFIDVSLNRLTELSLYQLLNNVEPNSPLTEIDFSWNEFGVHEAELITIHESPISFPVNLRKVELRHCSLTNEILPKFLSSFLHVKYIKCEFPGSVILMPY